MLKIKLIFFLTLLITSGLVVGCGESVSHKSSATGDTPSSASGNSYPNSALLVSNEALELSAPAAAAINQIIIDTRSTEAYNLGHIPSAISLPHAELADGQLNLKTIPELEALLSAKGLSSDAYIVLYDDTTASWGAAGRVFWALEYLGCNNIHILNGGWDKWLADALNTENTFNGLPSTVFTANVDNSLLVSKEHIKDRLEDRDFVLIDTRSDEEFIGWQLYGEARGGHISGAVQLPYEWSYNADKTVLSYDDLKSLLNSHGITSDKEIVGYCTAGIRSGFTYFLARLMDYPVAANYDASLWDWAAADEVDYPMTKMARYQQIVYPNWIVSNPEELDNVVIVETGWGPASDAYLESHIPGAIWVNTDEIESNDFYARNNPPVDLWFGRSTTEEQDTAKGLDADATLSKNWWNLYPDQYLIPAIAHIGINRDTTVVVYGRDMSAAGRVAWALMYAGVEDVRILNGGIEAWNNAGHELDAGEVVRTPVAHFDDADHDRIIAAHPEYLTTIEHVVEMVNDVHPDDVLADIRTWDEYIGATAPYSYIPASGRIPGALWGQSGDGPWDMNAYTDADATMISFTNIEEMWADVGITRDKNLVAHYCGTGWRAALTWFYAHAAGWDNVSVFDSGWYEWSMDAENDYPIVDTMPDLPETE